MYRQYKKAASAIKKLTPGESLFLTNCQTAETLQITSIPKYNGTHYICDALLVEKFTANGKEAGPWYTLWAKKVIWEKEAGHQPIPVELRFNTTKKRVRIILPVLSS
ncbi:hypothetical protein KA478_03770 [Patescibacteria group bacterium]|nr:hypothetical protein [Patescibacteria group bacterium]